jgi:hypothetical protein
VFSRGRLEFLPAPDRTPAYRRTDGKADSVVLFNVEAKPQQTRVSNRLYSSSTARW